MADFEAPTNGVLFLLQREDVVPPPSPAHSCVSVFQRQGEDVVSSKPESAFALAAVLLALQLEFPELSDLTLAHCQARCPYLVPLYPAQLDGDTNEQYYR